MIIDGTDGSQAAGSQTGYSLHGEQHVVGGGFLFGDVELLADFLQDGNRFPHMAGSPVADLYYIFSLLLKGEVFVEGGNTIDLGVADAQLSGSVAEGGFRKVVVFLLDILHDGDDLGWIALVLFKDRIQRFKVNLAQDRFSFLLSAPDGNECYL